MGENKTFETVKEFVFIFRSVNNTNLKPSPEQMLQRMKWLQSIEAEGKLVDKGNTLSLLAGSTKMVRPGNLVADGPYTIKASETNGPLVRGEFVTGYMVVKTHTIDEAVELAKTHPSFGSVAI